MKTYYPYLFPNRYFIFFNISIINMIPNYTSSALILMSDFIIF